MAVSESDAFAAVLGSPDRVAWTVGHHQIGGGLCPAIMGILNCTPDSFSDGGKWADAGQAIEHGLQMVEQGATIIDVGGESTRPGAQVVDAQEELRRVLPVVKQLAKHKSNNKHFFISVDTVKASVAEECLAAGCDILNDISAGAMDAGMLDLFCRPEVSCVLNHMRGTPQTMQQNPAYENTVQEVFAELQKSAAPLLSQGVSASRICLDPGIGFGKRPGDNYRLMTHLQPYRSAGFPVLLGLSRKTWIPKTPGLESVDRLLPSLVGALLGDLGGVSVLRVHDVAETAIALRVLEAARQSLSGGNPQ